MGPTDLGDGDIVGPAATPPRQGYLTAFEHDGALLWKRVFAGYPSSSDGTVAPGRIAVNPAGAIVLAGGFRGTVDFGGGPVASNEQDAFFVVYGIDGRHQRDRTFSTAADQFAAPVAFGPGGALTLAGTFNGSIDLGSGLRVTSIISGFIARIAD